MIWVLDGFARIALTLDLDQSSRPSALISCSQVRYGAPVEIAPSGTKRSMRRREFISLAGAAAIWSRVATAQQQKLPFVGVLTGNIADDPGAQMRVDAFRQGMTDLGWSANNNYRLDVRWPGPNLARQEYEARELV